MTLRIAHIVRRFSFSEWGGTENVVWHLAREQKKQGLEPEILCTSALDRPGTEQKDGITIRRFPYFYPYFPMNPKDRLTLDKKGGSPLCPALIRTLKAGSYQLLHIHAGGRLALYAARLARQKHLPTLLSLHGGSCTVPPQELEQMLRPLRHKFSYGGILDRLLRVGRHPEQQADALLALSTCEKQLLKQHFPDKKIYLFPNGVPHRPLPPPDPSFRPRHQIPEDAFLIICISRIDYQKNQKILAELTAELRSRQIPAHLLLAGPVTSRWYCDELQQMIRRLHLENHFTLIPGLPPDSQELLQIFRQGDCFVLPSAHEPFGIVALEALDAGIPLVAAATGGLTDFLLDHRNALLFPFDSLPALVDCCLTLIRQPELRKTLIDNGPRTLANYRWPALVERLTRIYRELLHE